MLKLTERNESGPSLKTLSESEVAQSCLTLCDPWTVAHQAPLSMGFSRQEYWSGLPFPSPRDLPNPGIKPRSPALQADRRFNLWAIRDFKPYPKSSTLTLDEDLWKQFKDPDSLNIVPVERVVVLGLLNLGWMSGTICRWLGFSRAFPVLCHFKPVCHMRKIRKLWGDWQIGAWGWRGKGWLGTRTRTCTLSLS